MKRFTFVQITDSHLLADEAASHRGVSPADGLRTVLDEISRLPEKPDLILHTGDVTNDVADAVLLADRMLHPLGVPYAWLPGNHDQWELIEPLLPQTAAIPERSFQMGGARFILLNSRKPGEVRGRLAKDQLAFLEAELAANPQEPTVVCLHHHLVPLGTSWMDRLATENPDDFFAVADRHEQIVAVLSGHVHQASVRERNRVRYYTTPSTAYQFLPQSATFGYDDADPGYRLGVIDAHGRFFSQVKRVPFAQRPVLKAK